jgi:hypothetical protein
MLALLLARCSLVALTSVAIAQDPSWLKPVARLSVPMETTIAADVAADGSVLVVLTKERTLRVYSRLPLRELRRFVVPEKLGAADVRITADNSTVVVFDPDGKPTIAVRLADGARLETVPDLPAANSALPTEVRDRASPEIKHVRVTADGRSATFCDHGFLLWTDGVFHSLDAHTIDAMLTGDGKNVLVRRNDTIVVLAAAGGASWSVPDFGPDALVVPIGAESRFVAVDSESLVVADANTRQVVKRIPIAQFPIAYGRPAAMASNPDGSRLVLTVASSAVMLGDRAPIELSGWLLDTETMGAKQLPLPPILASWVHDGFALLSGKPGPCSSLGWQQWTWLTPDADPKAAPTWPGRLEGVPIPGTASIAAIPGRREFVHACSIETLDNRLLRFDASNGRVITTQPKAAAAEETYPWYSGPVVVGDYLIDACYEESYRLELRRLADLSLLGTASYPSGFNGYSSHVAAAGHAARLLFWFDDKFAIYDFVPPPTPAKK